MDAKTRYLEASVIGATPERRLQALLDGAVSFIGRARAALAEEKLDECHNCTIKAQDIYLELLVALDPEAGEYVANLQGVYYLLYDILLDANIRKDDSRYAEAQAIAEQIRDLWDEVIKLAATEKAQAVAQEIAETPPPVQRLNLAG